MRPLLIGQAPGPRTDPDLPLFPLPVSSAGGRLCKFLGMSTTQYLRTFDRVNLLREFPGRTGTDDKFPITKARIAAQALRPLLAGREVLLMGRGVAQAFDLEIPFLEWREVPVRRSLPGHEHIARFGVVPHPSGRNRWHNSPENLTALSVFLGEWSERVLFTWPRQAQLMEA